MDLISLEKIVQSQFVWAILCIAVVVIMYKALMRYIEDLKKENQARESKVMDLYDKQRTEGMDREERLMAHLERTTDTLISINDNLENLEKEIGNVHLRIDDVWKEVKQ